MALPSGVTHERIGRVLVGVSLLTSVALGYLHHPAWLLLAVGTAANLALSGLTDRCAVKSLLIRMGFPGERDVGRAEGVKQLAAAAPAKGINRLALVESHERAAVN